MTASRSGGTWGFLSLGGTGAPLRTELKITAVVGPPNGACPVAISYSTAPKLNKSVRGSNSSPRACSGDMYATVPTGVPGVVSAPYAVVVGAEPTRAADPSCLCDVANP